MSRPICGPFGRKCPDRSLVRRKSLSAKDYGRTHFELLRRDRTCETGFESGRCLSRPALVSRPNPTLGRRGWVNYLWVSFLLKASVPTHRIDRDHPATADNPRGNRPSPAALPSTGGDLFSPLVKWIPITGGDPFFVPGGDPLPSEQMLTEILLGGAHRRMLNFKCSQSTRARGASDAEKDPTLHSATKTRFVQDQFCGFSSVGRVDLVGARRSPATRCVSTPSAVALCLPRVATGGFKRVDRAKFCARSRANAQS